MKERQRGLTRLAFVHFLLEAQFWFPIWVIFLVDRGFSLSQIVVADVIFRAAVILLEFPLGIVGDHLGRKRTYFLGAAFGVFTFLLLMAVTKFILLILCWLIWAFFLCLISGTDAAYRYEILVMESTSKKAVHIFGFFNAVAASSLVVSHATAGTLYAIHPNLPILLNAVSAFIAAGLILSLPDIHFADKANTHVQSLKKIVKDSFILMRSNRKVMIFVTILAIWSAYHWTVTLLFQPLLKEMGIPVKAFGIVFVSFTGLGIIGGLMTGSLTKRLGTIPLIIISVIIQVISVGLTGFFGSRILPILGIVFLRFAFFLADPVLKVLLNQEIDNKVRASLISLVNLLSSIIMIVSRPFVAFIAEIKNIHAAFSVWFFIGILLGVLSLILLPSVTKKQTVSIN